MILQQNLKGFDSTLSKINQFLPQHAAGLHFIQYPSYKMHLSLPGAKSTLIHPYVNNYSETHLQKHKECMEISGLFY